MTALKTVTRSIFVLLSLLVMSQSALAAIIWTDLGNVTNSTDPSQWANYTFDVTTLVAGSSSGILSFDLRNDGPNPDYTASTTESDVQFGVEGSDYFVHFAYVAGGNSSHWRNVELNVDGLIYVDQYGAFNNHLGDEFLGTAYQGAYPANNILGETGDNASTYVLQLSEQTIPEPATLALIVLALAGLSVSRRRSA